MSDKNHEIPQTDLSMSLSNLRTITTTNEILHHDDSPTKEISEHEINQVNERSENASGKSTIDCPVCGDTAIAHFHYGGMCCYSCKAFFRRVVNTYKVGSSESIQDDLLI